jgi:hypothetical protein
MQIFVAKLTYHLVVIIKELDAGTFHFGMKIYNR